MTVKSSSLSVQSVLTAVEHLGVDAVAAWDLAIEAWSSGSDVNVADAWSSRCQWNWDWNPARLSVWTVSTRKGSRM
jgi:hypothetical protein